MREICHHLKELLRDAVERDPADAILLSGGIDTSSIAVVSSVEEAFTVVLGDAPDLYYSKKVAEIFDYEHHIIRVTEDEALREIPEVIKILKTFDPAIPNDLAIYLGLKEARMCKVKSIMTGDGADELFAGYSFMHELDPDDLKKYIRNLSRTMQFSSNILGREIGVEIKQPFVCREVVKFALEVDLSLKIKKVGDKKYGKWVLRRAFEDDIPDIIWRDKAPIELGSGFFGLRETIRSRISDDDFKRKIEEYDMKFINKEHLFFYEIYKDVVGDIPKAGEGEICPFCNAAIDLPKAHCYICGHSPPL
ncbi:MAG: asparagine synthase-related protein [Halobacteriota archaeon]|nr:asparagine synthase-related protein [Halobacteriota archaeon]